MMSVTCQDVLGSPPTFHIAWEVEHGNEAVQYIAAYSGCDGSSL